MFKILSPAEKMSQAELSRAEPTTCGFLSQAKVSKVPKVDLQLETLKKVIALGS